MINSVINVTPSLAGWFDPGQARQRKVDGNRGQSTDSSNISKYCDLTPVCWNDGGLDDPVTDTKIVQRYRKLVSVHHPDKGGDKDNVQEINEAYAVLIRP